jgi:hypothetical protein
MFNSSSLNVASMPEVPNSKENNFIKENYDLLAGKIPTNKDELVLIVDSKNRINGNLLTNIGLPEKESYSFDDILDVRTRWDRKFYGKSFKPVL